MYPLRLSADEQRRFTRALRGVSDEPPPDENGEDESTDGPKDGDTPTDPTPDPGGNPMRMVTANIAHGMTLRQKAEDVQKVRGLGSVILWQEMNPLTQTVLHQHLPDATWTHVPGNVQVATRISVKRSLWTVEQAASYLMHQKHPNIAHRKPVVTVALLTLKGTSVQFLAVNSHFVPHAWCNHNRPAKPWRKDKWLLHYDKFQSIILDARSKGLTVVGGGDFNRPDFAKFHADQVWFRQARIDYLLGLQAAGGATFTKNSDQSVSLNSDHNALVTELSWTAGTNALRGGYNWPGL
jgi:hypothetical protein